MGGAGEGAGREREKVVSVQPPEGACRSVWKLGDLRSVVVSAVVCVCWMPFPEPPSLGACVGQAGEMMLEWVWSR